MNKTQFKKFEGFLITRNGVSILAQLKALFKKENFSTTEEQITLFKAFHIYHNSIHNRKVEIDEDNLKVIDHSEPTESNEVFYKYVSKYVLENYIKKGIFKLGTVSHYQKAKNNKIKDESEGYTYLTLQSKTRQLSQAYCSGFNFLIFCGSYIPPTDKRSKYLKEKFGSCVLKITNTSSFRRELRKHVQAKRIYYKRVEYDELKILRYKGDFEFSETEQELIDDKTFNLINKIITPNSIFRKPIDYLSEYELRFAFETIRDKKNHVIIHNKGLLDYIEIIEN